MTVTGGYTTNFIIKEENGIFEIHNTSSRDVWYNNTFFLWNTLFSGETDTWIWDNILENEQVNVDFEYSGYHVFSKTVSETITGGFVIGFEISPDGGGIEIWDNYDLPHISYVYLSPSNDMYWGEYDLTGAMYFGDHYFWTVEPGWWDIMVIDNYGEEYYSYDNYIGLDETSVFQISDMEKTSKSSNGIKTKKFKNYPKTIDRVEIKNIPNG